MNSLPYSNHLPSPKRWVQQGATVYTDEYDIYHFLDSAGYGHRVVTHGVGEYARGDVHVNTAEALFSLLRPYLATFRGMSNLRSKHAHVRTGHKIRHVGVPNSSIYSSFGKMAKVEATSRSRNPPSVT